MPGVPNALLLGARYLRYPRTRCQVSHMQFYLVPGFLDTPEPAARCPIRSFTWCQVSYSRYPRTYCQVSQMHFYLVPGILDTPEPGARCPICTFTWCQVSLILQNLVPGVPYALLLGARCSTWCSLRYSVPVPGQSHVL